MTKVMIQIVSWYIHSIEIFEYLNIIKYMTQTTVEILKALADETRLGLVRSLVGKGEPVTSCEVVTSCASFLALSQPAISHHFIKLVDAGVLREEKRGTQKAYALNRELLASVGIDATKL